MNGRERMRLAMARQRPPRVPVMCQLAIGHYFLEAAADAVEIWHDSEAFAAALVELQSRYRFDGILVNLPGRPDDWRTQIDRIEPDRQDPRCRRVCWCDGRYTVVPADDIPHVHTRGGQRVFPRFEDLEPEQLFYVEPHGLHGIATLPAHAEEGFPPWQSRTLEHVIERTGGKVSVHGEVFSPLSQLMELLDITAGMMALVLDPGKVTAILERLAAGAVALGCLQAAAGCDAILVSSAFAGAGFISRAHYRRFELPSLARVIDGIHARHPELPVYVHTCGAIGDRLDLIEQTGADGIDTLDPPPLGTVELADAVDHLQGRLFLKGNVDPVGTMLNGTPDDVLAAARERLAIAAEGGGYILSTACSVPPHAPAENITQLAAAVDEVCGAPP